MKKVDVFLYGSYMNPSVLEEQNIRPEYFDVTSLQGFDLVIGPRANLVPAQGKTAWGVTAPFSHAELDLLYSADAAALKGERYLPEAVIVTELQGCARPALCYLAHDMAFSPAEVSYVRRILEPAEAYGFPAEYLEKIRGYWGE